MHLNKEKKEKPNKTVRKLNREPGKTCLGSFWKLPKTGAVANMKKKKIKGKNEEIFHQLVYGLVVRAEPSEQRGCEFEPPCLHPFDI